MLKRVFLDQVPIGRRFINSDNEVFRVIAKSQNSIQVRDDRYKNVWDFRPLTVVRIYLSRLAPEIAG